MYKKLLAKVTATAMVITMVSTFGFTSFASEDVLEGNQTVQVGVANEDEEKIVNGDVTVDEGIAVSAISGEITVNGDVTGNVDAMWDGDVTVKGDVTSNEDEYLLSPWGSGNGIGAVTARGEGASVTVEGDVDASKLITERTDNGVTMYRHYSDNKGEAPSSVVEYDTTTVTGGADAGVYVEDGATVTVKGTITAGENGAVVKGNSTLNVGGDVVSNGKEITKSGTEYINGEGASFTKKTEIVNGKEVEYYSVDEGSTGKPAVWSEYSSNGINTDGNGTIVVEGDVTGQQYGITIDNDEDGKAGSIVVLGAIKGEKYGLNLADANSMYKYVEDNNTGESYAVRAQKGGEKLAKEIPDITVYAIEGSDKAINDGKLGEHNGRTMVVECYQAYQAAYESIVNAINYIIKQDDKSNSDYGITVDATKQTINDKEYFTTKINQAFSVAAKLPDGYTISGGENVTVVDNGNGTFSLALTNEKGGINLKAVLRPVSTGDNSSSGGNDYEVVVEEVTQPDPASTQPDPAPTQPSSLVITSISGQANAASNPEQAAFLAAISGDKPAQTISFSVGNVTPLQYKEAVINNVASVPANGALNLVTDKPSVIDYKMVEALSARSDIDVNVVFNYDGKRYKVVIPAGYDMKSLLDKNGYCGFLRLLAVLGGETI
ncbi:hypothetical protein SAMN04487928_104152 [Butyrivibrio proteoclasticus]|uniref:Uncharacterized protein n=1 Tax=Butyrivibrio proteoclasticus TaxID=43305 RepID=A0A1I5RR89_9FIRM|nr:hypothetical protein [Butyrivibrio proteoclasticus]SFP61028.1 hypothetical protein SAMN04487928_104152 [Butyrivibrio proteoclasticus]